MSIRGTQADPADDFTVRAGEVLAQYRAVVLNSIENGDHIVKYPSAARDVCYGITQEAAAASGDYISVRRRGVSKAVVAEAGTLGRPVMIYDTVGRVNAPSSNLWASGDGYVGSYEETPGASGDEVAVFLNLHEIMP